MRVIPGSHQGKILPHLPFSDENNLVLQKDEIKISPREHQVQNILLKPGEISLHHGGTIHQSNPNQTKQKRVGFIVRFVTSQLKHPLNPILQVRGTKELKHLPILQETPYQSIGEGIPAFLERSFENPV